METIVHMVKSKFRDHVRSKTDVAMKNEALCKFLCHNVCIVHQSHVELGIESTFWPQEENRASGPDVMPDGTARVGSMLTCSACLC